MELCAAHDMCPVQPRTAEKKFTPCLIPLSLLRLRLAATGSFPFSRYRYRLIVLDYWVVKRFVLVHFFLGKQSGKNSKIFYFDILVGGMKIQAVRRPEKEWQPI